MAIGNLEVEVVESNGEKVEVDLKGELVSALDDI